SAASVVNCVARLVSATRPGCGGPAELHKYIAYGASPRASQCLVLGAKARALLAGRFHVDFADLKALAAPVLRHRLVLNFHARAAKVDADTLIERLLHSVPQEAEQKGGADAMLDTRELADPEFFSRLESVELRARSVVEGFLHGLHRSPYIGFSVEFASHHEYVPGDDPRHINWKLYARQHRLYVK